MTKGRDALSKGKLFPDKPYYRIGEVAKCLGVDTHVLRYWESEFPQIKPSRAPSGHRIYHRSDVELLADIKELLHGQGYTLAGAKRLLAEDMSVSQHPTSLAPNDSEKQRDSLILAELKSILALLDGKSQP